jgi:hypothetical protein
MEASIAAVLDVSMPFSLNTLPDCCPFTLCFSCLRMMTLQGWWKADGTGHVYERDEIEKSCPSEPGSLNGSAYYG